MDFPVIIAVLMNVMLRMIGLSFTTSAKKELFFLEPEPIQTSFNPLLEIPTQRRGDAKGDKKLKGKREKLKMEEIVLA